MEDVENVSQVLLGEIAAVLAWLLLLLLIRGSGSYACLGNLTIGRPH